ncbi:MAG: FlgD immunoglobulin-like domain containing protein [candidate division WOR-3 bacterium]
MGNTGIFSYSGTISNNTVIFYTYGIATSNGNPVIRNNLYDSHLATGYPFYQQGSFPTYSNNTYAGNYYSAIATSGTLSQSGTWGTIQGQSWPYIVVDDITVPSPAILTIPAGTIVKFLYTSSSFQKKRLTVDGRLNVQGTAANPVYFTSSRDDSVGGDLDPTDANPAAGDWGYIKLNNSINIFRNCVVKYGGYYSYNSGGNTYFNNYMVWCNGCSPTVDSCSFAYSYNEALRFDYSPSSTIQVPTITSNRFIECPNGITYNSNGNANVQVMYNSIIKQSFSSGNGMYLNDISDASVVFQNTISNYQYGINFQNTSPVQVSYNVLRLNKYGFYLTNSSPMINNNDMQSNRFGAYNTTSSITVNAQRNWWGSQTGPSISTNPNGVGDSVSLYVDYSNWLTTPPNNARNVVALSLNPNPIVSEVMQGGVFHRYYKTVDSLNNPVPYAWVKAVCGEDTSYFCSDNNGIVDVSFSIASYQPGILNGAVIEVSGHPITPIPFTAQVLPRRYDRSYNFDASLDFEASFIGGLKLMASKTKGLTLSGTNVNRDTLRISDRTSLGASPTLGASIGVGLNVNNVALGAYAGAELYAGGAIFESGQYKFPYPVPSTNFQDGAALLLFLDPTGYVKGCQYIIPVVEWLLGQSINSPLITAREKGEVGIDIFGGGGANFSVGGINPINIPPIELLNHYGASGEIGGSIHGILSYQRLHQDNYSVINAEQYGEINGNISADFSFIPLPGISPQAKQILDDIGIFNPNTFHFEFNGQLHAGLAVYLQNGIKKVKLYFIKKPFTGDNYEVYEIWFESSDIQVMQNFINSFSNELLIGAIRTLSSGNFPSIIISPIAFPRSCYQIFQKVLEMQSLGQNIRPSYYKYVVNENELSRFTFGLDVGLIKIDFSLGIDFGVTNEKNLLVNYGKWLNGKMYNLAEYSDDQYTQRRRDVDSVPGQLLSQVLTNVWNQIFNWVRGIIPFDAEQGLTLNIANCSLYVPIGAIPSGDTVTILEWHWLPETTRTSDALRKFRQSQQLQAGMQYGIGGFYAIHKEDRILNISARLKICYADSEIVGIDESQLAIYRWNDSTRKWIYIGGTVKPESNFVRTNINRFGTYTIAPAVPTDTFPLIPDQDSLPANGVDTVNFNGGPIRLNNGNIVPNGTLITISTSVGTILTPDADTTLPGVQILTQNGYIQFQVKAPNRASISTTTAISVYGNAIGSCVVKFYDVIPPSPPVITEAWAQDSIMVNVIWQRSPDNDILGYKVHYDRDTIGTYQGTSPYDISSPIDVGSDTSRVLALPLHPDSNYYITVTAYDISRNNSAYSNIIKIQGMQVFDTIAPSIPQPIAPRPDSAIADSMPTMIWHKSSDNISGISHYELHLSNNFNIDTIIFVNDTTFRPDFILPDTIYFWQLRAIDRANNQSDTSPMRRFIIDTRLPTVPNLLQPQNNSCLNTLSVCFSWTEVTGLGQKKISQINMGEYKIHKNFTTENTEGSENENSIRPQMDAMHNEDNTAYKKEKSSFSLFASDDSKASPVRYIIEIDTNLIFTNPVYTETTALTCDTINLFEGQFYWRVRAYDLAGNQGDYSDTFNFIADTTRPSTPILIYPPHNALLTDTFIWHKSSDNLSGVKGYHIQIDYDSLFSDSLVLDTILLGANDTIFIFTLPNNDYYWRVCSFDRASNYSFWSDIRRLQRRPLIIDSEERTTLLPLTYILFTNKPNPFRQITEIKYGLPCRTRIKVVVYNSSGQVVATLLNGIQNQGWYTVKWNGQDAKGNLCPNGIYFYRMETPDYQATKKMLLLR